MNKIELKLVRSVSTDFMVGNEVTLNGVELMGVTELAFEEASVGTHGAVTLTIMGDVTVTYHDEDEK